MHGAEVVVIGFAVVSAAAKRWAHLIDSNEALAGAAPGEAGLQHDHMLRV